jgi:hypothetical protein
LAKEADDAVAGSVDDAQGGGATTDASSQDSVPVKPFKPPQTEEEKEQKKSWIEIKLLDEEQQPVPGEKYRIILPDGQTAAEGTLDEKGFARVEGFDPGTCQVTFPDLDKDSWQDQ